MEGLVTAHLLCREISHTAGCSLDAHAWPHELACVEFYNRNGGGVFLVVRLYLFHPIFFMTDVKRPQQMDARQHQWMLILYRRIPFLLRSSIMWMEEEDKEEDEESFLSMLLGRGKERCCQTSPMVLQGRWLHSLWSATFGPYSPLP